jgi:uncharacterized coiled-coil protein SlyX
MSATPHTAKKATTDADSIDLSNDADTESLVEAVTELSQRVSELESTVQEQAQTISELHAELDEERQQRGQESAQVRARVHDVEERVEDIEDTVSGHTNPGGSTGETAMQDDDVEPQTDIEEMVDMPDSLLDSQTANVQRACFVAKDVSSYTTSCPAGRVITSGELRRVLQAGTDCAGHTQTVARVIDLLDRTGGESTTVVERRGERRLVFEQDLVDRLSARSQGGDGPQEQAV